MSDVSDVEEEVGVLVAAKEVALKPFRLATTRTAWRTYIGTIFFFVASLALFALAATAYLLFYYSYVPVRGFSRPIYLQFEPGKNPYGDVPITKGLLVSDQRYDIWVDLHLPRTPINTAAGNFMLDLQLLAPTASILGTESPTLVARERRPSILTYYSNSMEHVHKTFRLPLYLFGFRSESEAVRVQLMEGVQFTRWSGVPETARLELQSQEHLQVYTASLEFKTKLRGLRYLMYNHRFLSFAFFTTTFWVVEVAAALAIWLALGYTIAGAAQQPKTELSDPLLKAGNDSVDSDAEQKALTPATTASPSIKRENPEEDTLGPHPVATDGDVEDEAEIDEDPGVLIDTGYHHAGPSDSGIGTSMDSGSNRPGPIRRRSSKPSIKKEEF